MASHEEDGSPISGASSVARAHSFLDLILEEPSLSDDARRMLRNLRETGLDPAGIGADELGELLLEGLE